jgi:hypothetical protein
MLDPAADTQNGVLGVGPRSAGVEVMLGWLAGEDRLRSSLKTVELLGSTSSP